jgi:hypothetical protein
MRKTSLLILPVIALAFPGCNDSSGPTVPKDNPTAGAGAPAAPAGPDVTPPGRSIKPGTPQGAGNAPLP